MQAAAVAAPLLGLVGYFAAAGFLVFPPILTMGLIGQGFVVYDLIADRRSAVLGSPRGHRREGGSVPVVVATWWSWRRFRSLR